jgi:hypothetical protein
MASTLVEARGDARDRRQRGHERRSQAALVALADMAYCHIRDVGVKLEEHVYYMAGLFCCTIAPCSRSSLPAEGIDRRIDTRRVGTAGSGVRNVCPVARRARDHPGSHYWQSRPGITSLSASRCRPGRCSARSTAARIGRSWHPAAAPAALGRRAAGAGVRRRFAPDQLRHARARTAAGGRPAKRRGSGRMAARVNCRRRCPGGPTAAARRTRRGGETRTTAAPAASPWATPRRRTDRRRA